MKKLEIPRRFWGFMEYQPFSITPGDEGFQVNKNLRQKLASSKRRIQRRLDPTDLRGCAKPILTASNIHYEIAERTRGLSAGGIGAIHALATRLGLPQAIDRRLKLLRLHLPYHESDHVLTLAYLPLCGGTCLQDLELLRHDEVFLDALGARRIPDPTTAGDFCRRFTNEHLQTLHDVIDDTRLAVWQQQPASFFRQAIVDMDGFLVETSGQCKRDMDIAYDGTWGYHALVLTLAHTGEVLRVINRSGNRPSQEGAAEQVDQVVALCLRGGFGRVLLRGDTKFSQSERLDGWDDDPRVRFLFGYEAMPNLKALAENLPASAWQPLFRPSPYEVKTQPRRRPDNVKEAVVKARGFENHRLRSEEVAEFRYRPTACKKSYRMVVVRKNIAVEKGEQLLFDRVVYFFYITNLWESEADEIVWSANERCDQENLLAQLHGGVRALRAAVDDLESNGAYMVMTALAWNLKAWWALSLPERPGRWQEKHQAQKRWVLRLEFKSFVNAFVRLPCQLVRTGRKLVFRLLAWNPHQPIFFRLLDVLRC
ncbi:MAG TPA: IS1380 family transposase [Acidobacteriaceae bacterium]|nr:IS1380 family transposase [Acidobacteriaceae bacterium]